MQPPPNPQYQPPKRKSHKRLWLTIGGSAIAFIVLTFSACNNSTLPVVTQPAQRPTPQFATRTPTQAPVPNLARLGGSVHDFDLKLGKEDTSNGGIGYQSFGSYTSGQDPPTDKFTIAVENGHVESVKVTLPKESPLSWQDGIRLCQSFLSADAVFQSAEDFSPQTQAYQQIYMSKTMSYLFSADHFVAGTGVNPQPLPLGTVQIMYYYSSWGDHTTSGAQVTSCSIGLGENG